ncbi:MAG: RNA polymerase sigma factor [Clostridia bacterium]|nr:RNA polymerase sigma factor [Clostridia bacterium]
MNLDSLATRVSQHDKRAFEALYNELRQAVYSACLGIVKSHALAEELMQDTFVAVWTHSSTFKGKGYKTWILTIAKNKSLNLLKKRARESSVDFSENDSLGSYESDVELSVLIKTALKLLSPEERQIVLLRSSGVKAKEIAEYLKIPRPTVSWKYKEALNKLKNYMEGKK